MEFAQCPNHLVFNGRGFNLAGVGRARGSQAFVCPANGEVLDVFAGKVVSTGNVFALCTVANNGGLPSVRVDNHLVNGWGPLRLGQVVFLALDFDSAGPHAKAVWPAQVKPAKVQTSVEKLGTITQLVRERGFGYIQSLDGSPRCWFHFTWLRGGLIPLEGITVRFVPKSGQDGRPQADNIRPA